MAGGSSEKGVLAEAADVVKGAAQTVTGYKEPPAVPSLVGKTAIVTGGLGYASALDMAKAGAHIILAGRHPDRLRAAAETMVDEVEAAGASGSVETGVVDLSSFRSVYDFSKPFRDSKQPIHILVNNAGFISPPDETTDDDIEITVATMHFGPWYLTQLLADNLAAAAPSRVVWVTSLSEGVTPDINFDNLKGKGHQSDVEMYALAKLYMIMDMKELHARLAGRGVEVFAAQPGVAATEFKNKTEPSVAKPLGTAVKMLGPIIGQKAEEGAQALTYAATSPNMTGKGGDERFIVGPFYSPVPGLPGQPSGAAAVFNIGPNTATHDAKNPRAFDDEQSSRLYDATGRIVSENIADFDSGRAWL